MKYSALRSAKIIIENFPICFIDFRTVNYTQVSRIFVMTSLMISFLLISDVTLAQSVWEVIRLDDNVSFTIPSDYERIDSLGQTVYSGRAGDHSIEAAKIPEPQVQISNVDQLKSYYQAFQRSVIEELRGSLLVDSMYDQNNLYIHRFNVESHVSGRPEIHAFMIAFIDHHVYSFTYTNFRREGKQGKVGREAFFRGVTIHNPEIQNQFDTSESEAMGETFGVVLRYVLLAVLALALVLWLLKKNGLVIKIKNGLALLILGWGCVNLLLYAGNLFYQKHFPSLLVTSGICVAMGLFLGWLKVPKK